MVIDHVLVAFLWIAYGVTHSVFASLGVKNFFKKRLGKNFRHYRLAYTLMAFVGLILIVWFQLSIQSNEIFIPTLFTNIIGGIITIAGLLIMLVCIKKYFMSLSGLRSLVEEESYPKLIISGIHRYVRHPLYLGTFLFIWGMFIFFPTVSLLISNFVITIYTLIGIGFEEKKLVNDFGDQYRTYQETVPKLIPKL